MIIGILFIIKGAFNILKGINYFIFKDNFKMIPMELTSVYKSPVSTHEITYIYYFLYDFRNIFIFIWIKSYFYLYISEKSYIIINNRLKYDDCCL